MGDTVQPINTGKFYLQDGSCLEDCSHRLGHAVVTTDLNDGRLKMTKFPSLKAHRGCGALSRTGFLHAVTQGSKLLPLFWFYQEGQVEKGRQAARHSFPCFIREVTFSTSARIFPPQPVCRACRSGGRPGVHRGQMERV